MSMSTPKNFEPFYDWPSMSEDQAQKLAEALLAYKDTADVLKRDFSVENAAAVCEAHERLGEVHQEIREDVWTVPAMVHIAGEKRTETNPDNPEEEGVIQRCQRCGSVLVFWREGMWGITEKGPQVVEVDDVGWWEKGEQVGKAVDDSTLSVYLIQDRELEPSERECVALSELDFATDKEE